jgi:cystathionine beta-lyase/cystathionine gamma-synthase
VVRDVMLGAQAEDGNRSGRRFDENGMRVYDVEVLDVEIGDEGIATLLVEAQHAAVEQTLTLDEERRRLELTREREEIERQVQAIQAGTRTQSLALQRTEVVAAFELERAKIQAEADGRKARLDATLADQQAMDAVHVAELARRRGTSQLELDINDKDLALRLRELEAEVHAVAEKARAVSPDLVAALTAFGDRALAEKMAQSMAPLAILGGESVAEVLARLLRGTKLAQVLAPALAAGDDHVFTSLLPQWNVRAVAVEHGRWGEALAAHAGDIALVYLETPANPTLEMIDLGAVREAIDGACPDRRVPMVVDNTFLGPVFQSPLEHGADLVVYSATKFLGGHSDLVAGALTARDPAWIQQVKGLRAFLGTICEPFTAWMLQRSLATLWLRMTRQSKNAARLVNVLRGHRAVAHIHYPTLFVGEQARIFQKQCRAPGSMIALDLHGGREAAFRFLDALKLVRLAVSLGGVESLASHPRSTTASEMSDDDLRLGGVTEGLVRISIGVEYWRDLARDLTQALDAAAG